MSRVQQGAAGVHDMALSLPTVVGRQGGLQVLQPAMDDDERAALAQSAQVLRDAHASIASGA